MSRALSKQSSGRPQDPATIGHWACLGGKQAVDEVRGRLAEAQEEGAPSHVLVDLLDQAIDACAALHADTPKALHT